MDNRIVDSTTDAAKLPLRDLSGRRSTGSAVLCVPVRVFDRNGAFIGKFRSPRKLARAITRGSIVLVDGDTIHIGHPLITTVVS
jgi:hypothetical protein